MELSKSVALVTGAAKGLGKAIVENLLSNNAIVIALDKDVEALNKLATHENLHTVAVDLLDQNDLDKALTDVFAKFKVNVLVNNAGILHNKPLVSFGKDGFTKLTDEE